MNLSDQKIKVLLISTLVAIIVLAVGAILWESFGGSAMAGPSEFPMKCIACGYEWTASRKELAKLYQESMPMPDPNNPLPPPSMGGPMGMARPPGVNCPKCGAKQSAYPMTECPSCHKFFLSARITDPNAMLNPQFKDVCPNCGIDINEYFRNKAMPPAAPKE